MGADCIAGNMAAGSTFPYLQELALAYVSLKTITRVSEGGDT